MLRDFDDIFLEVHEPELTLEDVDEQLAPRAGKHSFLKCIVKNVSSPSSVTLRTLSLLYSKAPFHDLLCAPIVKISCVVS